MRLVAIGFRGFPNIEGGIETHAEQLYPRLAHHIDEIHVVTRREYDSKESSYYFGDLKMVPRSSGPIRSLETVIHSLNGLLYALRSRADVLHIHGIGPAILTPVARICGLRTVVTHHGKDYDADKWGVLSRAALHIGERVGMRFASRIITVSENLRDHVEQRFRVLASAIPNGVLMPAESNDDQVLQELGLFKSKYIVEVARVTNHKRQHELIQAFLGIESDDCKLVIVGECPSGVYGDRIRSLASSSNRIVLAGFRSGIELATLFRQASLFCLPSSYEGMPIAVLEALSYGLPVLLSDIPAHLELKLPDQHYHEVGNIEELRRGLRYFIEHSDLDAIRNASLVIAASYDWDTIASRTWSVIHSSVAGRVG